MFIWRNYFCLNSIPEFGQFCFTSSYFSILSCWISDLKYFFILEDACLKFKWGCCTVLYLPVLYLGGKGKILISENFFIHIFYFFLKYLFVDFLFIFSSFWNAQRLLESANRWYYEWGVRGLGWLSRVLGSKTPSSVRMKYIFFKT